MIIRKGSNRLTSWEEDNVEFSWKWWSVWEWGNGSTNKVDESSVRGVAGICNSDWSVSSKIVAGIHTVKGPESLIVSADFVPHSEISNNLESSFYVRGHGFVAAGSVVFSSGDSAEKGDCEDDEVFHGCGMLWHFRSTGDFSQHFCTYIQKYDTISNDFLVLLYFH